jgi:hypothetical protein
VERAGKKLGRKGCGKIKEIRELLFLDLYNTEMVPEEEEEKYCTDIAAAGTTFFLLNIVSYTVLFFLQ